MDHTDLVQSQKLGIRKKKKCSDTRSSLRRSGNLAECIYWMWVHGPCQWRTCEFLWSACNLFRRLGDDVIYKSWIPSSTVKKIRNGSNLLQRVYTLEIHGGFFLCTIEWTRVTDIAGHSFKLFPRKRMIKSYLSIDTSRWARRAKIPIASLHVTSPWNSSEPL